jgi:hypothetical protein
MSGRPPDEGEVVGADAEDDGEGRGEGDGTDDDGDAADGDAVVTGPAERCVPAR